MCQRDKQRYVRPVDPLLSLSRWRLFTCHTSSSETLGDVRAIVGRARSSSSSKSLTQIVGVRKETSKRAKKVVKDNSCEHEREIFALFRLFLPIFLALLNFPSAYYLLSGSQVSCWKYLKTNSTRCTALGSIFRTPALILIN